MVVAAQPAFWPRTVTSRRPALRARTASLVLPLWSVVRRPVVVTPSPLIIRRAPATPRLPRRTAPTRFVLRGRGTVWRLSDTRRQPFGLGAVAPGAVLLLPEPMAMCVGASAT